MTIFHVLRLRELNLKKKFKEQFHEWRFYNRKRESVFRSFQTFKKLLFSKKKKKELSPRGVLN